MASRSQARARSGPFNDDRGEGSRGKGRGRGSQISGATRREVVVAWSSRARRRPER
jgi:hypothetical protein